MVAATKASPRKDSMRPPTWEFPLLKREFLAVLRSRSHFWLLFATVSIASLFLLMGWVDLGRGAPTPFRVALTFSYFSFAQLVLVLVAVAASSAGAIASERENQTYELLHSTLLSPFSIVLSKAISSIGYILVFLISFAPAVSLLFLLGGVGLDSILGVYAVTFLAAFSAVLVSLTVSLRSENVVQAVLRSMFWVLFWNGGHVLLATSATAVLLEVDFLPQTSQTLIGLEILASLATPVIPISELIWDSGGLTLFPTLPFWVGYAGYAGILSLLHLLYLLWRVRNPELPVRRPTTSKGSARGRSRTFLTNQLIQRATESRSILGNPVLLREVQHEFYGTRLYRWSIFSVSLLLYAGIAAAGSHDKGACLLGLAQATVGLVALVLPGLLAPALTREKDAGTYVLLNRTFLSPVQVLVGKVLAALYATSGVVSAAFLTGLVVSVLHPTSSAQALPLFWTILVVSSIVPLSILLFASICALCCVVARRTTHALLLSYGSLGFLLLGVPMLALLTGFDENAMRVIGAIHPILALVLATYGRDGQQGLQLIVFLVCTSGAIALLASAAVAHARLLIQTD